MPWIRRFSPLAAMLIFPLLGMMYTLTDRPTDNVYTLVTDYDRAIPLIKLFVLPYSIWIFYIYACLVYFLLKDPKVYYRSLATYTICTLICYMVYMVFQTTVPRPMLTGSDPVTRLLAYVYNRDKPFNCFPSIHCFSSYMVMKALAGSRFRGRINRTLIYGTSCLIILSTQFVKQHVLLDAFAAFLLVELVHWALIRLERAYRPTVATPNKSM